jgi:hypothetical protein
MRIWARLHEGVVVEVVRTARPIKSLFHPSIAWVEATATPCIEPGWHRRGEDFVPPAAPTPSPTQD